MVSEIWLFIEGSIYHVTTSGCINIEVYLIPQLGLVLSKLGLLFHYFLLFIVLIYVVDLQQIV